MFEGVDKLLRFCAIVVAVSVGSVAFLGGFLLRGCM